MWRQLFEAVTLHFPIVGTSRRFILQIRIITIGILFRQLCDGPSTLADASLVVLALAVPKSSSQEMDGTIRAAANAVTNCNCLMLSLLLDRRKESRLFLLRRLMGSVCSTYQ
jgi:cyanate permease